MSDPTTDPMTDPMTDRSAMPPPVLTSGRQVSLLPRAGGHAWAAEVDGMGRQRARSCRRPGPGRRGGRRRPRPPQGLAEHRDGSDDEEGVTIFAGTAAAAQDGVLVLAAWSGWPASDDVPRSEPLAGWCASPHADDHPARTVPATDISRAGVRLAMPGRRGRTATRRRSSSGCRRATSWRCTPCWCAPLRTRSCSSWSTSATRRRRHSTAMRCRGCPPAPASPDRSVDRRSRPG